MIDALMYAVRDGIRAAGIGYGTAECDIMEGPEPPPRCGNFFASVHEASPKGNVGYNDNNLDELYEFCVTLTMRVTVSLDVVGTQQIHRNVVRELARRQGFYAKAEGLRALIHMNWNWTVRTGQTPPSANDNLAEWVGTGTVYGFCEPMRFITMEFSKVVGGEWFSAEPDAEDVGVKSTMRFGKCRRLQAQTQPDGPFV